MSPAGARRLESVSVAKRGRTDEIHASFSAFGEGTCRFGVSPMIDHVVHLKKEDQYGT